MVPWIMALTMINGLTSPQVKKKKYHLLPEEGGRYVSQGNQAELGYLVHFIIQNRKFLTCLDCWLQTLVVDLRQDFAQCILPSKGLRLHRRCSNTDYKHSNDYCSSADVSLVGIKSRFVITICLSLWIYRHLTHNFSHKIKSTSHVCCSFYHRYYVRVL